MKCGSQGCSRLAVARWAIQAYPLTPVQGTFLLCQDHDEWYQDMAEARNGTGPKGAFRIGLLADEQCLHSLSQRESARPGPT